MNLDQLKFILGNDLSSENISKKVKCFVLNNGLRMTPLAYDKMEVNEEYALLIGYKRDQISEVSTVSQIETLELKFEKVLSDIDRDLNNNGILG
jgi:hypothetical protein